VAKRHPRRTAEPAHDAPDGWERAIGHRFADPALLHQALTHRSASRGGRGSNERLEFLGDRVLGLLVAEWLIERHPNETEGDLGKRLAALVARPTLAGIAARIGLASQLIVPESESRAGVRARSTVMADAVEAVIAALYLDGGLPAARAFVRTHFAPLVEAMQVPPMPAKTRLQEWLAARGAPPPRYRLAQATGPAHAPAFTVVVEAHGAAAQAEAATKRAAEEQAAAKLLALLESRA
jgi:ribonuclease-3